MRISYWSSDVCSSDLADDCPSGGIGEGVEGCIERRLIVLHMENCRSKCAIWQTKSQWRGGVVVSDLIWLSEAQIIALARAKRCWATRGYDADWFRAALAESSEEHTSERQSLIR